MKLQSVIGKREKLGAEKFNMATGENNFYIFLHVCSIISRRVFQQKS